MGYESTEKPFIENQVKNINKKQKINQNAACEQKTISEKWKFGSNKKRASMNSEWVEKTIWKKIRSKKSRKTVKIKMKLPHVNKKPLARKRTFVQTQFFSLYFKIRAKKFHAAKPIAFSLPLLFRRDQKLLLRFHFINHV